MAITKLPSGGRQNGYTTCEITVSGTTSTVADIEGYAITGLLVPTIDSANLTFTASNLSTGTYRAVKAKGGTALTITAGTGNEAVASNDLLPLGAYRYIKIVSSAAQDSAAVTFTFIVKG